MSDDSRPMPAGGDHPTSLYRFFDSAGRLLYVGITGRSTHRFYEHNREKPWWPKVASATVEHHGARRAALEAESAAIRDEKPLHNIAGAGSSPVVKGDDDRRTDRLTVAEDAHLSPYSLVGSFFHTFKDDGHTEWQGCVVAEVADGVYLVELFSWVSGGSTNQQLVRIEDMAGWNFYDEGTWMANAYEDRLRHRDERIASQRVEAA